MFRFSILAGGAALISLTTIGSSPQGGIGSVTNVRLQSNFPGTQQTGHANINGTLIAGQLQGGGAGLMALNATNISAGTLADPAAVVGIGRKV